MDVIRCNPAVARLRKEADRPASAGFTLIELIAVVGIAGILFSLALPSFIDFMAGQRQSFALNRLVWTLHFARSEAVKRGADAVICRSRDGQTCTRGTEWQEGWIVFGDTNGDRDRNADEPVVRSSGNLPDGVTLTLRAWGPRSRVVYRPTGYILTNGTFVFCDHRGSDAARALILSRTGRIRQSRKTASGDPLRC